MFLMEGNLGEHLLGWILGHIQPLKSRLVVSRPRDSRHCLCNRCSSVCAQIYISGGFIDSLLVNLLALLTCLLLHSKDHDQNLLGQERVYLIYVS